MKSILTICLLMTGSVWASSSWDNTWNLVTDECPRGCISISKACEMAKDSVERESRRKPYQSELSSFTSLHKNIVAIASQPTTSTARGIISILREDQVRYTKVNFSGLINKWVVLKGTETYLLEDFVSSGKFCEWRGGHIWIDEYDWATSSLQFRMEIEKFSCDFNWCIVCHRCRRKIKVNKEVEELEK